MELKRNLRKAVLAAVVSACALSALAKSTPATTDAARPAKDPIAQLRGKLLYRHNQARKLEKAAMAADPELEAQIEALNLQKEELFIAAEPKLADVYREQKSLNEQIEAMKQGGKKAAEQDDKE